MSSFVQGLFTSSILVGTLLGSLAGGAFTDRFGRKVAIITVGVIGTIFPIGIALAPTLVLMMVARGFLGISVGLATVACPTYVSENARDENKGTLGTLLQLAITFGIFLSYLVALPFKDVEHGFRWMFGIGVVPGAFTLLIGIFMPESMIWVRRQSFHPGEHDRLIAQGKGSIQKIEGVAPVTVKKAYFVGELLAVAQQLTGINAFMYYAPSIFATAGLKNAMIPTVGLGLWNFVTTFIATFFVDRAGRRPLLLFGTSLMAVSCVGLALVYELVDGSAKGPLAIVLLLLFIAGFETGEGPLFWVVATELFSAREKGRALSILTGSTGVYNLILSFGFLPLSEAIGQAAVFWIFGGVGVVCVLLMVFYLPETKVKTVLVYN
jgi:SP family arabinose:H+ symporter-like MFS transporter